MLWPLETLVRIGRDIANFISARSRKDVFSPDLKRRVTIDGQDLRTLQQAAYALRQYSIDHDDYNGWRLSHLLRDADTPLRAQLAEARLANWIRSRKISPCSKPGEAQKQSFEYFEANPVGFSKNAADQ